MNTRLRVALLTVPLMLALMVALCGFEGAGNGPVLEVPGHSSGGTPPTASPQYEESGEAVPKGPDLRFHQLLKFYGCWRATVTARDLTVMTKDLPHGWIDQRYTICFSRDLSGELQPTISQAQVGDESIEDKGSFTELTGFDERVVSLVNHRTFIDRGKSGPAAPVHWYSFWSAHRAVEVRQVTNVSCLRESMDLYCTAMATAQCGGTNCYSFGWKAKFNP
jgi:hypothetical protein